MNTIYKTGIVLLLTYIAMAQFAFGQVQRASRSKNIILTDRREDGGGAAPESDEAQSRERRGPANIPFSISSHIDSDFEFPINGILNVKNTVYRDANITSGYYYYLPAAYSLSWSEESGVYDLNANYNSADEGNRGRTTVTAILKPKLNQSELKLVKQLLGQNIKGKPEEIHGVTDLAAIPMTKAPEISFTNLAQFDVDEADISIRAPSDLMDPILISFTTGRIDDLMGMFLNDIGLYGNVLVYPAGEDITVIPIPFNLKIDDPATFGRFELQPDNWRKNGWKNKTDYPVILTQLHVMKQEPYDKVKVYTWNMGDIEIPENAKVTFDASRVPLWIDTSEKIKRIWMDYTILECYTCNQTVQNKIIKGTSHSRVNNIQITVLTPLKFSGVNLMKIKLRSIQADPNGQSKVNLPTLTIDQDGQTVSGGQLFVSEGATPTFEYLLQLYTEDGVKYEATQWQKSNDLEVVIGSKQITELFSEFKNN